MGCAASCTHALAPAEASPALPGGSGGPKRLGLQARQIKEGSAPGRQRYVAARPPQSGRHHSPSFDQLELVEVEPSPINLRILSAEEDIVHSPAAQRNPLLRLRRNAVTFPLRAGPRLHRTKASSGLPFECGKVVSATAPVPGRWAELRLLSGASRIVPIPALPPRPARERRLPPLPPPPLTCPLHLRAPPPRVGPDNGGRPV
eukprot:EG_transcript_25598